MREAVTGSHYAKTKQGFKKIRLFFLVLSFFRKGICLKEGLHIFLDAWIFDDKLTGSIFTLNSVLHFSQRRLCCYFIALEDCLKEQNIDIFGLIGI